MNTLKTIAKAIVIVGSIMILAAPSMAAGQQKRTNAGGGTGDRIRTPGSCKGIETSADRVIAARYRNGGGTGQGTRSRTRTPGQCKGIEGSNNELMV